MKYGIVILFCLIKVFGCRESYVASFIPFGFLFVLLYTWRNKDKKEKMFQKIDIIYTLMIAAVCIGTFTLKQENIVIIAIFTLIQAFDEEIMFRYFLLQGSTHKIRDMILNSILFSLMHLVMFINIPIGALYVSYGQVLISEFTLRFLMGMAFCMIYFRNKSVMEVTFFHFLNNITITIWNQGMTLFYVCLMVYLLVGYRKKILDSIKHLQEK